MGNCLCSVKFNIVLVNVLCGRARVICADLQILNHHGQHLSRDTLVAHINLIEELGVTTRCSHDGTFHSLVSPQIVLII